MPDNKSLLNVVNPAPNSTVMIYDVHASESGALSILDDLYNQIKSYQDKSVKWIFVVSTPNYKETDNIKVYRFPWVKRNWGYRFYFDNVTTRMLIAKYNPDKVFSLQNKGIDFYKKEQFVYLHLPFILTDHKFDFKVDGKKLWLYQNVISKSIFKSLVKVDKTIVQTKWMKDALIEKGKVAEEKILILEPDISTNRILTYEDLPENRRRFFYPATAFTYKNHMTLLKAICYAKERGLNDYEVIFTIKPDENGYTKMLKEYIDDNHLNVLMTGQVTRTEVFELYSKSVLLFPSYVESFGLPLLEAKLTGTYVIASDCPFSREILADYERAKFFQELDYKAMGDAILSIY